MPNATHEINDPSITILNSYWGSTYQQAVSYLTDVETQYYADNSPEYGVFGFEYRGNPATRASLCAFLRPPGEILIILTPFGRVTGDDNYITWVANGKPSWTMHAESIGPDPVSDVGQRLVSEEPMYLILNFGELCAVANQFCESQRLSASPRRSVE